MQFLVLDEADRLLDREDGDFHDDLETIIEKLPQTRQTLMFSATLSETVEDARNQASKEPFFWRATGVDKKSTDDDVVVMPDELEQKYVLVPEDVKDGYLVHLVKLLLEERMKETEQMIIFSKTCKSVQVKI